MSLVNYIDLLDLRSWLLFNVNLIYLLGVAKPKKERDAVAVTHALTLALRRLSESRGE